MGLFGVTYLGWGLLSPPSASHLDSSQGLSRFPPPIPSCWSHREARFSLTPSAQVSGFTSGHLGLSWVESGSGTLFNVDGGGRGDVGGGGGNFCVGDGGMKVVGGWGISGCWWGMGVVGLGVRMGMETGWGMGTGVGYAHPSLMVLRLMPGRACPHQSCTDHPKL